MDPRDTKWQAAAHRYRAYNHSPDGDLSLEYTLTNVKRIADVLP